MLERHLRRLEQSAIYFGFPIVIDDIMSTLKNFAETHRDDRMKVRLLISKSGKITITGETILDFPDDLKVSIASSPINKQDPFLYHKTTNRIMYKVYKEKYPDCFDVLLWNEAGELTEFTNGNIVVELTGKW